MRVELAFKLFYLATIYRTHAMHMHMPSSFPIFYSVKSVCRDITQPPNSTNFVDSDWTTERGGKICLVRQSIRTRGSIMYNSSSFRYRYKTAHFIHIPNCWTWYCTLSSLRRRWIRHRSWGCVWREQSCTTLKSCASTLLLPFLNFLLILNQRATCTASCPHTI